MASPSSPTPTTPTFMTWGPRNGPHTPNRSGHPGEPGAPLESRSAVPARRIVPGVGRLLEIVVGLPGPELRDVGEGVDDGVLQAAVHPLDLAHVHVHVGVAVVVELHRPSRHRREFHLPQGAEELVDVLAVAVYVFRCSLVHSAC